VAAPPPEAPTAPTPDHFAMALYYQRVGDFDGALAQYRRLLEQNDASAEVHNNLGLLYQDRGQYDEAVKRFQRSIAIGRKCTRRTTISACAMRSNRPDAAAAEFRVALGADPRNVESLVNLALVQKAAGRVADARDLLRRALVIDPRNAGSHYNLAVVADESGDTSSAVEHYRAFLKLGTVAHADLAAQVRARLAALGS
jgi:Tfp pilus assembly protein PilF